MLRSRDLPPLKTDRDAIQHNGLLLTFDLREMTKRKKENPTATEHDIGSKVYRESEGIHRED